MGFWFNNFLEFERKRNRTNRLILNFYYVPSQGESPKSAKIFVNQNITIPTNFLIDEKMSELEEKLTSDDDLNKFKFEKREIKDFCVGGITMPYTHEIIKKLGREFQTGNYDKFLRFNGFYPERKVTFTPEFEQRFLSKEEIEINNLDDITFGDFLTEEEFDSLPYLVIDIEKPLWKKKEEKRWLNERKELLKLEEKYTKFKRKTKKHVTEHKERKERIGKLEKKLTKIVDGVGEIPFYDERFTSNISFITAIWGENQDITKEIYVLDPNDEFIDEEFAMQDNYGILKFRTETDLIKAFIKNIHERKPIISYGQNQAYDIIQIRFASENNKQVFDPVVKDVKPKRDFTRKYMQRLREDLIYLDTLWLSKIFYPHLRQNNFGGSFKLENIANSRGIKFKKSLTHEELRDVELRRIMGKNQEIRKQAMRELLSYAAFDVEATDEIIKTIDFKSIIHNIKELLPFCTMTEIAFSTNCMNKLHEYIHFKKSNNLPHFKYKQKRREDKIQIFKKRFPKIKKEMLEYALNKHEIPIAESGVHDDVSEFYISPEKWLKDIAFTYWPMLKKISTQVGNDKESNFVFLQYLKTFMRDIFVDCYFARRKKDSYIYSRDYVDLSWREANTYIEDIQREISKKTLDKLIGSFKFLKNHFRSIYVALESKDRKLIRPTSGNLESIEFPGILGRDADLYLLRTYKDEIRKSLSSANKKNLTSFLNNFSRFEKIRNKVAKKVFREVSPLSKDIISMYLQYKRAEKAKQSFFAKYGSSIKDFKKRMGNAYSDFALEIKDSGSVFLEQKGDYVFIKGEDYFKGTHLVGKFNNYQLNK